MTNDDGTGRLRFKHDDLVEWDAYYWTGAEAVTMPRRGRIVGIGDYSAVVDTLEGPKEIQFCELRKATP